MEEEQIDYSQINNQTESIEPFKVYVRIRPLQEEKEFKTDYHHLVLKRSILNIIKVNKSQDQITVLNPCSQVQESRREKVFNFQNIFTEKSKNTEISHKIVPSLIDNTINGFNSTIITYGVTGSGKTHTMFGSLFNQYEEKGICIYAVELLFEKLIQTKENFKIKASYLEIYNENVIDLLKDKCPKPGAYFAENLLIIEDPVKGILVPGLNEYNIESLDDLKKLINIGNSKRTMAPTDKNQFSSRSHAILQITINQYKTESTTNEVINTCSKLLLVDLAGWNRKRNKSSRRTKH